MITNKQLEQIKNELKTGMEVEIVCGNSTRLVELEKKTYDFAGKLRIKLIEVKNG